MGVSFYIDGKFLRRSDGNLDSCYEMLPTGLQELVPFEEIELMEKLSNVSSKITFELTEPRIDESSEMTRYSKTNDKLANIFTSTDYEVIEPAIDESSEMVRYSRVNDRLANSFTRTDYLRDSSVHKGVGHTIYLTTHNNSLFKSGSLSYNTK